MTVKALVLCDDPDMHQFCSSILELVCGQYVYADNIDQALSALQHEKLDLLLMDYYINYREEWRDAYEAMKADLTAHEIGIILWLPKIEWDSAEARRDFYSELQSRRIKSLIQPFGSEELLTSIAEILKEQGKSLMTEEQLKTCPAGNRARLKQVFNCSDEDLEEKFKA